MQVHRLVEGRGKNGNISTNGKYSQNPFLASYATVRVKWVMYRTLIDDFILTPP
jgi:hypothetical protein